MSDGVPRADGPGQNHIWNWDEARRTCLRLAHRYAAESDAEDVAQEALIRAWRFRARLRRGERLQPWLAIIVRNEAARYHAKRRPEPMADVELTAVAEDDRIETLVTRASMEEAISRLDTTERLLLDLRYGRDLTQPMIARLLRMPEGTVKVRLHRARAKLHQALSKP